MHTDQHLRRLLLCDAQRPTFKTLAIVGCTQTYDSLKLCRVVGSGAVVHITLRTKYETDNSYSIITTQTPTKLNNPGYVCVCTLNCFVLKLKLQFLLVLFWHHHPLDHPVLYILVYFVQMVSQDDAAGIRHQFYETRFSCNQVSDE